MILKKSISVLVLLTVLFFSISSFSQVSVGSGGYATSGGFSVPDKNPAVTDDFSQKVLSTKWWVNFISQDHSTAYAHPLTFSINDNGLDIGYPGNSWNQGHSTDLSVGIEGMSGSPKVCAHSHWSVSMRWEGGGNTMEALMGQGLPFVYFSIEGGNVNISGGEVWYNENGVLGVSAGGSNYGIFGPTGCSWSTGGNLSSSLDSKGYLSVAILPDNSESTLNFFKQYAYSHITNTKVSWEYSENDAQLVSTFAAETDVKEGSEEGTVFALLRHQWLDAITPFTEYTYGSARGEMKVVAGPNFVTSMTFDGILPGMPNVGYDAGTLNGYLDQEGNSCGGGSTYAKNFGKVAVLAQLAHMNGNTSRRDYFVEGLKNGLERWFNPNTDKVFYYHEPWNRLIGYPAAYYSDTRLTDHHFHYAYFIQAAAMIAKFDPEWAQQDNWGGMVEMLIRDVNTWDENDPLFARWGYFDPYEGHGWADGMGFSAGNDQESSSESMNFNANVIMWGINTGNNTIRDLGIFMYVHEARAIEQYWWDVDEVVFPDSYDHTCVGMVWSNGGSYSTWFSGNTGAIHGINFLPITSGHLYLGRRPDYIPKNYDEGFSGQWDNLFYEFLAFADADQAFSNYSSGSGIEGGDTRAHTYHHLKSLQAVGQLNKSIVGDIPSYAVFEEGNTRSYTAYNPENITQTVTFSDGFSMEVPARTQITESGEAVLADNIIKHQTEISLNRKNSLMINMPYSNIPVSLNEFSKIEVYTVSGKKILVKNIPVNFSGTINSLINLPDAKGIYIIRGTN